MTHVKTATGKHPVLMEDGGDKILGTAMWRQVKVKDVVHACECVRGCT